MLRLLFTLTFLLVSWAFSAQPAFAQVCVFSAQFTNHNRYVYRSDEECPGFHSAPWGNWGVSSNVGTKQDSYQFMGWKPDCNAPASGDLIEWNSCTDSFRTPGEHLNFPNPYVSYPYPANGYPYSDPFTHNDYVPPYGSSYYVDQYSPCGAGVYGGMQFYVGVSPAVDTNYDGIADQGGCKDLHGYGLRWSQNYMTMYELDPWSDDDLVESLYYPDLDVILDCTPYDCFTVTDTNFDGWADDVNNPASPEYKWPTIYQNDWNEISYATDPGVWTKRIDATVRVGYTDAYYSGPVYYAGQQSQGGETLTLAQADAAGVEDERAAVCEARPAAPADRDAAAGDKDAADGLEMSVWTESTQE